MRFFFYESICQGQRQVKAISQWKFSLCKRKKLKQLRKVVRLQEVIAILLMAVIAQAFF
jgi:hypothetical protein